MNSSNEQQVRSVLEAWAAATREGRLDDVLANHLSNVLIYDVLAPMKYEGADAYRRSWDGWQPDTNGGGQFHLEELSLTVGEKVAFASGLIRCGGTFPDGRSFEDLVRATFCLVKFGEKWKIAHQHISKPIQMKAN